MHRQSHLSILATGAILACTSLTAAQPAEPAPQPEPTPPATEPVPEAPPAGEAPADEAPAGEAAEDETPAGEAPAGEAPTQPEAPPPTGVAPGTRPRTRAPQTQPSSPGIPGLLPTPGGPAFPDPGNDAAALEQQGSERPGQTPADRDQRVFSEDWWSHARPTLELHGYFRVRAELFHKFGLDRVDLPQSSIWPRPSDDFYETANAGARGPELCTPDEAGTGSSDDPGGTLVGCHNNSQAGANLRFRLNPEIVISDNLRVISQIDMLDNLVLGSTPSGFLVGPATGEGYAVGARSGATPTSISEYTQVPPRSGINSVQDSIEIKRAWAEYSTPVGQLRFGRMPSHWGLGIFQNSGDKFDDDWQSTVDRISFISGIRALDLYVAGAWDFASEGPTSQSFVLPQQQAYDLGQLDDVDQYVLAVFRRKSPELTQLALAKGEVVVNGGAYVMYQKQHLANDFSGSSATCSGGGAAIDCEPGDVSAGYVRRAANVWTPDLWFQLLYKKFRFELEALTVQGSIDSLATLPGGNDFENPGGDDGWDIRKYGFAAELEQKLVEDRLRLKFMSGWASGDADVDGLAPSGVQSQLGDRTISNLQFHPGYRIDLILHRHLLTRVSSTYYFRPSVDYDFMHSSSGQRLGGGVAAIWTRASQFVQSPGHERDLGIELNAQIYFQSKDGVLNDDPTKMGGFFSMLQYGVLFPLSGLGYQSDDEQNIRRELGTEAADLGTAQTMRLYLGVFF